MTPPDPQSLIGQLKERVARFAGLNPDVAHIAVRVSDLSQLLALAEQGAEARRALEQIAAFKTGGTHRPGQIKNEHRAVIGIARAALIPGDPS